MRIGDIISGDCEMIALRDALRFLPNRQGQPPPTDAEATARRGGVGCDELMGGGN